MKGFDWLDEFVPYKTDAVKRNSNNLKNKIKRKKPTITSATDSLIGRARSGKLTESFHSTTDKIPVKKRPKYLSHAIKSVSKQIRFLKRVCRELGQSHNSR
jgi:hypothetical protein